MSSVPYAAPWATGFDKYSTQLYVPTLSAPNQLTMVIPTGQWWRIIYISASFTSVASAGTRTLGLQILDSKGVQQIYVGTPLNVPASSTASLLFAPNVTAFANSNLSTALVAVATIPDLLWPPNYAVDVGVTNLMPGDTLSGTATYAIEVYTEDYDSGKMVQVATPIPLIP